MNPLFGGNLNPIMRPYSYNLGTPYQGSFTQPFTQGPAASIVPQTSAAQQNFQSMIPQSNMIWIDDVNQIAGFPTGRGWQQWFGLKNDQVIFVRETDMNGVIQPMKKITYQIEDTTSNQNAEIAAAPVQTQTAQASANSVSRDEFNKLSESVRNMTEKLSDLLK